MRDQIITSLLDVDFYKFSMQNAVFQHYFDTKVRYKFYCRTPNIDFSQCFYDIREQIVAVGDLRFTEDQLQYLRFNKNLPYSYINDMLDFSLNPNDVNIDLHDKKSLEITVEGTWFNTILWETIILSIVNECYYKSKYHNVTSIKNFGLNKLKAKIQFLKDNDCKFKFIDFGTRRRYSKEWHKFVIKYLKDNKVENFIGTSNVQIAMDENIPCKGTLAHEFIQAHVGFNRFDHSQKAALNAWYDTYGDDMSITLTDTYTTDFFLANDFDRDLSNKFKGVRQDSGCPFEWTEKMLAHYKQFGIDAKTKTFVYSDGLDFEHAHAIYEKYHDKANLVFGIGTNLTNDMDVPQLNIVMKLVECDGFPTIKMSDHPGKTICEDTYFKEFATRFIKSKIDCGKIDCQYR